MAIHVEADGTIVLSDSGRTMQIPPTTPAENIPQIMQEFTGPDPLPAEVPMYKVLKYLTKLKHEIGTDYRFMINAAITQMEQSADAATAKNGALARDDWERSPNLVTDSPLVLQLAAAIGMTNEQFEAMVRGADAIP